MIDLLIDLHLISETIKNIKLDEKDKEIKDKAEDRLKQVIQYCNANIRELAALPEEQVEFISIRNYSLKLLMSITGESFEEAYLKYVAEIDDKEIISSVIVAQQQYRQPIPKLVAEDIPEARKNAVKCEDVSCTENEAQCLCSKVHRSNQS